MTNDQIEHLLECLAAIAGNLQDLNEMFEAAMETDDEGVKTLRVVDVDTRHER